MAFDPLGFLGRIDPGVTYTIIHLTGGVVNITIRATKDADAYAGSFPGHASLILKYAPPYVAGVGEDAPMSEFRQTIEARALSLFQPSRPHSLISISTISKVSVPTLLHHDVGSHVLVLSDLGSLPNLSDIFSDLGGHIPGNSVTFSASEIIGDSNLSYFETLGTRLGAFFAYLHASSTLNCLFAQYPDPRSYFFNPSSKDAILEGAIRPIADQLKGFPDLITSDEADHLRFILVEDFLRQTSPEEESLVLGDSWTGAVLVSPPHSIPSASGDEDVSVGVIDWEFAGLSRGVHGDMAQFLAHLELLRIVASQSTRFSGRTQAINTLIKALVSSYLSTSDCAEQASNHSLPSEALRATIARTAFLSHGAEIINCAFWKKWACFTLECPRSGKHEDSLELNRCVVIRQMVEKGLWFLRHAGKDVRAFTKDENMKAVEQEVAQWKQVGTTWLGDLLELTYL